MRCVSGCHERGDRRQLRPQVAAGRGRSGYRRQLRSWRGHRWWRSRGGGKSTGNDESAATARARRRWPRSGGTPSAMACQQPVRVADYGTAAQVVVASSKANPSRSVCCLAGSYMAGPSAAETRGGVESADCGEAATAARGIGDRSRQIWVAEEHGHGRSYTRPQRAGRFPPTQAGGGAPREHEPRGGRLSGGGRPPTSSG